MLFFTRGYIISQESFLSAEASSKPFPCVSPEPQPTNPTQQMAAWGWPCPKNMLVNLHHSISIETYRN